MEVPESSFFLKMAAGVWLQKCVSPNGLPCSNFHFNTRNKHVYSLVTVVVSVNSLYIYITLLEPEVLYTIACLQYYDNQGPVAYACNYGRHFQETLLWVVTEG